MAKKWTKKAIREKIKNLVYDCETCDQYGRCGDCKTPKKIKKLKKVLGREGKMETKFKHLEFKLLEKSKTGKTEIWEFFNHTMGNEYIGQIKWNPGWRQYCSYIAMDNIHAQMVFSAGCHYDVYIFIKQLMKAR